MRLVQVTRVHGRVDRVKADTTPVVDLSLEDNQRVISMAMHEIFPNRHRKTSDWIWSAYIETVQEIKS